MAWSNPPAGILYYNGFWFPELVQTRGSIAAVYDATGRFVKYTKFRLRVETMIYPGCDDRLGTDIDPLLGTTYTPKFPRTANSDNPLTIQNGVDTGFEALRALLTAPGGVLLYVDKGIGTEYRVSGTPGLTTHLDVEFGPKPMVVSWEPIAGNKALRLVWEIEAAIPECTGGAHVGGADAGRIAEMSWGESYEIDAHGLSVHTQSGWLETVAIRQGSRSLYSADRHRAKIQPYLPIGFQRTSQSYTVSPDMRRLEWSITDTEHPSDNPLPAGTVECDVDYTVASEGKSKVLLGNQWRCSLTGRITVAKDQPRGLAWAAFLKVVKSKLGPAYEGSGINTAGTKDGSPGGTQYNTKKQLVLLRNLSITEEVFGRGMSFSFDWTLFTELGNLFGTAGIWKPIGTNWNEYQTSMTRSGSAWKPRGTANLGQSESGLSQALISLCDLQMAPTPGSSGVINRSSSNAQLFETRCPSPEDSWLSFDPEVILIEDSGRVTHYPLGGPKLDAQKQFKPGSTGSGLSPIVSAATEPITQTRRQPYYRVKFIGTAARLGHSIPVPRLIRFGGQYCTLTGTTKFKQKQLAKGPNCFLYLAVWSATYDLAGAPTSDLTITDPNPKEFPA